MAIIPTENPSVKVHRAQPEARIQSECVRWLWNEHPETRGLFIHIPNEGNRRSIADGAVRKAMGIVAGAPDTFLFIPRGVHHGLAIEFKTEVGRQSSEQKKFQQRLEFYGYRYEICRSLDQFKVIITDYLKKK